MSEPNTHARYHAIVADLRDVIRRASDLLADLDDEAARAVITTTSPELLMARRAIHRLKMVGTKSRVFELTPDELTEFARLLLTPEGRLKQPQTLLAERFGRELPRSTVYRWVTPFYTACRQLEAADARTAAQADPGEPTPSIDQADRPGSGSGDNFRGQFDGPAGPWREAPAGRPGSPAAGAIRRPELPPTASRSGPKKRRLIPAPTLTIP